MSTYLHITYAHIPVYPTVLHKHTSSLLCHLRAHSHVSYHISIHTPKGPPYHISTHPCFSPCHADTPGPYRTEALQDEGPTGQGPWSLSTHLAAVPGSPAGWRSSPPALSRCCCSSSATALPHTGTCLPLCHWPG